MIKTLEALKTHRGEFVTICGKYEEINGAQRPGKYVPSGRACIVLSDGYHVALDTQDAGIRPKEELENLREKQVQASGLYMGYQTLWGDGSMASIVSEALLSVSDVKLLE